MFTIVIYVYTLMVDFPLPLLVVHLSRKSEYSHEFPQLQTPWNDRSKLGPLKRGPKGSQKRNLFEPTTNFLGANC